MLKTIPRPFIVDPSSQATEWLKTHLGKEENLEVTNVNDERFFLNLELAVRFGKTLIIQDVNQIEPILYPLLREEVVGQGPYKVKKTNFRFEQMISLQNVNKIWICIEFAKHRMLQLIRKDDRLCSLYFA